MLYTDRPRGTLAGDLDGQGPSTIDLVSAGRSMAYAAAITNRQAAAAPAMSGPGFDLPWGSVGVGMVALVVALLYLDGRIL